jgi:polar amino acid transport system substrate-binding protein
MSPPRFPLLLSLAACATTGAGRHDLVRELAPTGRLRAAINFGNPVLAQKDAATGEPRGVSADLARELGRRLQLAVDFVPYDTARKVVEASRSGAWDVAFLAVDPERAEDVAFTAPYVVIEGTYAVPAGSPLRAIEDVDREGVRIAVGAKTAYELYLSRTVKHARLLRAPTSAAAIEMFQKDGLEAVAGVKQPLVQLAMRDPSVRVLDGRFMAIEQAMCVPRGRDAAARYVRSFVEDAKASGFVARALESSGQRDAVVAPPAQAAR